MPFGRDCHIGKNMNENIAARLKENIARLETTIRLNCWQKGYVANCKAAIASYAAEIAKLEA